MKIIGNNNSLFVRDPKLTKEWHPTKNDSLTPADVTPNSHKKIWWCCSKGHEWEAVISSRSKGRNCPYCSNKAISSDNCLKTVNPTLAKEWHPAKNKSLTPSDVVPGSNKKVWWRCKKGHEWMAQVADRSAGTRCPYCSGRLATKSNCLQAVDPSLAKEWHPNKNDSLTPLNVKSRSGKKVWWRCKKGHEWIARIADRSAGTRCPFCNSTISQLELRIFTEIQYLFRKVNSKKRILGLECDIYIPDLRIGIEVDSLYWHENKNRYLFDQQKTNHFKQNNIILIRIRETGLKRISNNDIYYSEKEGQFNIIKRLLNKIVEVITVKKDLRNKIQGYILAGEIVNSDRYLKLLDILPKPLPGNSLQDCNKKLSKEWHPTKNFSLTSNDVTPRSNKKVWWRCNKGHAWIASINNRSKGVGCPYCSGNLPSKDTCLQTVNPILAKEWHPTKNSLTPLDVTPNSHKKVWWLCKKRHEWETTIKNRNKGRNCPYCSGKAVCIDNCLQTLYPEIAKEWHPTKKDSLSPLDVTAGSSKKAWWLCKKGHEWEAVISSRSKGAGCPYCSGNAVSINNCLKTLNPRLAKEWHPTKNCFLTPATVTPGSGKKVWWICNKGHEWMAAINNRSHGTECPYCFRDSKKGAHSIL